MKLGEIVGIDGSGYKSELVVFAHSKDATKSLMIIDKQGDALIVLTGAMQEELIKLLTSI